MLRMGDGQPQRLSDRLSSTQGLTIQAVTAAAGCLQVEMPVVLVTMAAEQQQRLVLLVTTQQRLHRVCNYGEESACEVVCNRCIECASQVVCAY